MSGHVVGATGRKPGGTMLRPTLCPMIAAALAASAGTAAADDDVKAGEAVFKRSCAVCHAAEAGKNKAGPSLAGVVGRKAGAVEGFKYSDAMKNSGLTWSSD